MSERLTKADFHSLYTLLKKSFPPEEYRTPEAQKALFDDPGYTVWGLRDGCGAVFAMLALWDCEDFAFLEHLAVDPDHRSTGIGGRLLQERLGELAVPVCLEVEPPETAITRRRIGFYERNGFFLNPYSYRQPSLGAGKASEPLLLMTSGGPVDRPAFERIKARLYSQVYRIS